MEKIICEECGESFVEEDMDLVDGRWMCRECERRLIKCEKEEE